jgi:hypothetical protein
VVLVARVVDVRAVVEVLLAVVVRDVDVVVAAVVLTVVVRLET